MTPREFLDQVVRANVGALVAAYDDARLAFNAIASVDALAGLMYEALRGRGDVSVSGFGTDDAYRNDLATRNEAFRIVRDTAKAQKHGVLTRGNPLVQKADDVSVRPLGWGEARWDEGRWGSPPQTVAETAAGPRVLEAMAERAVAFLDHEMSAAGL